MADLPANFYGEREEALLFECGTRVAYCYDEEFQIERRFINAVPSTYFRGDRQMEWSAARWNAPTRRLRDAHAPADAPSPVSAATEAHGEAGGAEGAPE